MENTTNNITVDKLEAGDIATIITEIQNTSGTNDKKELLAPFLGSEDLYRYLRYVYDEVNYTYGKSKLPMIPEVHKMDKHDSDEDLEEMYALVEDMNSGVLKGKSADEAITDYLVNKLSFYEDLLFYIIKRNIKAGINARGINEVFGRVIKISP